MTPRLALVTVLVVALLVMAVQPPPAEADPTVVIALASVAVIVLLLVGYLIVANVDEQRRTMQDGPEMPVLVVYVAPAPLTDGVSYNAP
ncbi:MAG: hypothetical protein ACREM3_01820 [Candidatus Rokuibacteriota bacterium]